MDNQVENPYVFILPDKREIPLRPVSSARIRGASRKVLEDLRKKGERVDPPTFIPEIPNAAPGVVGKPIPYNDDTIQGAPEEVKKEYAEWKSTQKKALLLASGQLLSTLILRGTKWVLPEDTQWIQENLEDGVEVPEAPDERYVFYMLNEVLLPPSVAEECAYKIMRLSMDGMDPEVIEAFEASFRDKTWRSRRPQPE